MATLIPTSPTGRVFIFFDLERKEVEDKEAEKDRLYAYHRNLISQSQQVINRTVDIPHQLASLDPQELYTNRMTVQVLVDAKDAFKEGKRKDDLKEEEVENMRAGLREVTVARVSVLCWMIHLCKAFDAIFKGKNKEAYSRRSNQYDSPPPPKKKERETEKEREIER